MVTTLSKLPPAVDFDNDIAILKKLGDARDALAELRGVCTSIPNQAILINTLSLQEAKDSSAIENIVTTHDDLYRSDLFAQEFSSPASKEVYNYAEALRYGYAQVKKSGLLTNNDILSIQRILEGNDAGFRRIPGTALKNDQTGEVVYEPPQDGRVVLDLMDDLQQFLNQDDICAWHPLIKMAVIHHQFESIHPFYDGNGRTGRIINILYLVKYGQLNMPVLYLSRYINRTKGDYYRLLQAVRDNEAWRDWVLYMLTGVEKTAKQTTHLVEGIRDLMRNQKHLIRERCPKIYTQDLLNVLFSHPYSKIEFLVRELKVTRLTATSYLNQICDIGLLEKLKIGRSNYYVNKQLFDLLRNIPDA
ncbi:MAG: Fic family protein [Alphaproteobacteria bacterium]|nr:Fic family protein [Alphaproteobacteria bacterium]